MEERRETGRKAVRTHFGVLGCISGLKVRVCSFLDLLRGAGMGSLSGTRQEGGGEADPANKLTITENKHG
jgi:hypothetical protein